MDWNLQAPSVCTHSGATVNLTYVDEVNTAWTNPLVLDWNEYN